MLVCHIQGWEIASEAAVARLLATGTTDVIAAVARYMYAPLIYHDQERTIVTAGTRGREYVRYCTRTISRKTPGYIATTGNMS